MLTLLCCLSTDRFVDAVDRRGKPLGVTIFQAFSCEFGLVKPPKGPSKAHLALTVGKKAIMLKEDFVCFKSRPVPDTMSFPQPTAQIFEPSSFVLKVFLMLSMTAKTQIITRSIDRKLRLQNVAGSAKLSSTRLIRRLILLWICTLDTVQAPCLWRV